jgi:predicted DsbA family dithiol-disulfide isomerase
MFRKSWPKAPDSPAPGVIPEATHVHDREPELSQPGIADPQTRAENGLTRSWRDAFRRMARRSAETLPRERPSTSRADKTLDRVNRAWRRKIVSRTAGLRPQIDPTHDHLRGDEAATVTLVEYGDYESPSCIAAASELERLRAQFDGKLRLAFRHFPIGDAHPLALHAAEAAEAAGAQGRFWEMHDLIYVRDQGLEPALLRRLAKSLDLDLERFDAELADETHLRHVMEDFQSGVDSGVSGTPTFFINDERLDWDFEMSTVEHAVERAISVSDGAPKG